MPTVSTDTHDLLLMAPTFFCTIAQDHISASKNDEVRVLASYKDWLSYDIIAGPAATIASIKGHGNVSKSVSCLFFMNW